MLAYSHHRAVAASTNLVSIPELGSVKKRSHAINDNSRRASAVSTRANKPIQNTTKAVPVYSHGPRQTSGRYRSVPAPNATSRHANSLQKNPPKEKPRNLVPSNVRSSSRYVAVNNASQSSRSTQPTPSCTAKESNDRYVKHNTPSTRNPHVITGSPQNAVLATLSNGYTSLLVPAPLRSYNRSLWFKTQRLATPLDDNYSSVCYPIHETSPTELLEYSFSRPKPSARPRADSLLSYASQGASPTSSISSSSLWGSTQNSRTPLPGTQGESSDGGGGGGGSSISSFSVSGSLRHSRSAVARITPRRRSASANEPASRANSAASRATSAVGLRTTSSFSSYTLRTKGSIRHARRRASIAASDVATQARGFRRYIKDGIYKFLDPSRIRVEAHVVKKRLQRWADIDGSQEHLDVPS